MRCPESDIAVYGDHVTLADTAVNKIYDELRAAPTHQQYVGFDCEWEVSKDGPGRIAVVQVTTPSKKTVIIQVHQLCARGAPFPRGLKALLEDSSIAKVGAGIAGDSAKMLRDWNVTVSARTDKWLWSNTSSPDLQGLIVGLIVVSISCTQIGNTIDLAHLAYSRGLLDRKTCSLADLSIRLLRASLPKPSIVR